MNYSLLELASVAFLRFPPLLRVWVVLLMGVNLCSLLFLGTIYGKVAAGCVLAAFAVVATIHARLGFVRLLGIGHVFWAPMIVWLLWRLPEIDRGTWLFVWLVALIVCNGISLIVDTTDVIRFWRGEREPYYRW